MKKILSPIFKNFVDNIQTKFHILKFRVCVQTKSDSKSFLCQNRKSELLIDGLFISITLLTLDVRKRQNVFCKMIQKFGNKKEGVSGSQTNQLNKNEKFKSCFL